MNPARTSRSPAKAKVSPASAAGSGSRCSAWSARFDPHSCSWKIVLPSGQEGSTVSSKDWPSSGSMRSGVCSERKPLERPTCGAAYGSSVPTPTARDASSSVRNGPNSNPGTTLTAFVRMYPTPNARDHRSGKGRKENGHSPQLPEVLGGLVNPRWVEWLMGFPVGWTKFTPSATRKYRSKQQKHSNN